MNRSPSEAVAAERARWLADLAVAIEQAQQLAWQLGVTEGDSMDAKELYARLEVARIEVENLRVCGWATCCEEIDPSWINLTQLGNALLKSAS